MLTIFGASGDLTRRKIFPALYALAFRDLLPSSSRSSASPGRACPTKNSCRQWRPRCASSGATSSGGGLGPAGRQDALRLFRLRRRGEPGSGRRDTSRARPGVRHPQEPGSIPRSPPDAMPSSWRPSASAAAAGWTRLIVEKPFGHDPESARTERAIAQHRFAGTRSSASTTTWARTVQNLLAAVSNGIFEPVWNRQFIDHVQITVAESIGIESRAAFYRAGAIRDVFQNHLLQLVALTGLEPPIDFTAEAVRNEKLKVLKALSTPARTKSCGGSTGRASSRATVPAIGGAEVDLTEIETFVAAEARDRNWRWADTPFYVRVGKRLGARRPLPSSSSASHIRSSRTRLRSNVLIVHIQPNEGVSLAIGAKVPRRGCASAPWTSLAGAAAQPSPRPTSG